ncbi:hypothetical protein BDW22DRAFT_264895 [Trametopsis cervina]|nr:hypothetical protein BDW22DRAFT_264895 [Trametopsis cervina]
MSMAGRRVFVLAPPNISPRDSLAADKHSAVDGILKELKQCTRRLQTALASQHVDLQVLERLYYKGNNQHRTALFWRRVAEIRRLGRRLESADVHGLIESLRVSFWASQESQQNAKLLKGPWLCYPDAKTAHLVLRRLIDCHMLVRHMHDHVTKAHNHFNLELQTGAFLQFILTLTAISSRVAVLLTEIQAAVELACQTICKLSYILDPSQGLKVPSWLKLITQTTSEPKSQPVLPVPAITAELDEDIGTTVTSKNTQDTSSGHIDNETSEAVLTPFEMSDFQFTKSKPQAASSTIIRTVVRKETEKASPGPSLKRKEKKRGTEDMAEPTKTKKKKKQKDEIDDIFGF